MWIDGENDSMELDIGLAKLLRLIWLFEDAPLGEDSWDRLFAWLKKELRVMAECELELSLKPGEDIEGRLSTTIKGESIVSISPLWDAWCKWEASRWG